MNRCEAHSDSIRVTTLAMKLKIYDEVNCELCEADFLAVFSTISQNVKCTTRNSALAVEREESEEEYVNVEE